MNAMLRQHPDSAVTKIYKLSFESNNAEYQQHESQLHELENAVTQLEKDLERAQREYVSSGGGSKSHQSLSESTLAKREQKETMMTIANHLSAAQEALTMLHRNGGAASNLHERNAIRLLDLCRTNGGVYIKVGQHLANLDLLLPEEYIHILSSLFDDAPSTNYQDVCRVVTEDLGCSPDELFDDFSRQPFASASLAQVHTAKCKTSGKKVSRNYYSINLTRITKPMLFFILTAKKLAIKIQHKGLRETSTGDLFAMSTVVRIADKLFDDFNFMWICEELTPQLPRELDFKNGM
jgi:aarF domain-containing kinase